MSTTQSLLIAVDGGGTGCRVCIGTPDAGILAEAKGGPANINTSFEGTIANITTAVDNALKAAGMQGVDLQRATAHVGLAGADTSDRRARASAALPYGHCTVSGDRETSVAGVLGAQDGYVVALGTGTIIARQKAGQIRTVNGWGFGISDHASGAWLGLSLVNRVLLVLDQMEESSRLSQLISDQLGGLEGLVTFSLTASPGDYARFAPDIFNAAETGDPLALELLTLGASYLERGLTALGFRAGDVLALSGGVGPHYRPYLAAPFTKAMQQPIGNALDGAFNLARAAALKAL